MLKSGALPGELFVLHKCDNPPCVNPEHLFLGTPKDNIADMIAKGRARPFTKLSKENVISIRAGYSSGVSYRALAEKYRVSEANVRLVAKGKTWRHVR
jgi:hypothetical protein